MIRPEETLPEAVAEISPDFVEAISRCLVRNGFDRTSLEEIASEAGTSRATLYRRFGGREALFQSFLTQQAQPIRDRATQILSGPGSVESRLEDVLVALVRNMESHDWLKIELDRGAPGVLRNLIRSVNTIMGDTILRPLLEDRLDTDGKLEGFNLKFVSDWVVQQLIVLVSDGPLADAELRRYLNVFVMRALLPPQAGVPPRKGLAEVERSLEQALETVRKVAYED